MEKFTSETQGWKLSLLSQLPVSPRSSYPGNFSYAVSNRFSNFGGDVVQKSRCTNRQTEVDDFSSSMSKA